MGSKPPDDASSRAPTLIDTPAQPAHEAHENLPGRRELLVLLAKYRRVCSDALLTFHRPTPAERALLDRMAKLNASVTTEIEKVTP